MAEGNVTDAPRVMVCLILDPGAGVRYPRSCPPRQTLPGYRPPQLLTGVATDLDDDPPLARAGFVVYGCYEPLRRSQRQFLLFCVDAR